MPNTTAGSGTSDTFVTRWSIISQARDGSPEALNSLFAKYRPVLIPWVQSKFHASFHDAEDLVQSFAASLLRREFLKNVDKSKGRFRTFLFTALYNHVVSEFRKKKLPLPESLDLIMEEGGVIPPETTEEVWIIWVRELLKIAWQRLTEEAASQGHPDLCAALEPVFFADDDKPTYARIAKQLDMTEGAVKTAACRLRERFRGIIHEEVRDTVASEPEIAEELGVLLNLLRKAGYTV